MIELIRKFLAAIYPEDFGKAFLLNCRLLIFYIRRESKMKKLLRFLKDEDGVTAIEYGLIAALIAVAVGTIAAMTAVGIKLMANSE